MSFHSILVKYVYLQEELMLSGVCDEDKALDVIENHFLPQVGERQKIFEEILERMDVSKKYKIVIDCQVNQPTRNILHKYNVNRVIHLNFIYTLFQRKNVVNVQGCRVCVWGEGKCWS